MNKWHHWRDDRPNSLVRRSRMMTLVERSSRIRSASLLDGGKLDTSHFLDLTLFQAVKGCDVQVSDLPFKGMRREIEGLFDCKEGIHIFLREELGDYIYGPQVAGDRVQQHMKMVTTHECGHAISGHALELRKRNSKRQSDKDDFRLAHNSRVLRGREDWVRAHQHIKHGDLEEEADIVSLSLQVPILEIDGYLDLDVKDAIEQMQTRYDVLDWVAYNAALLAKSYRRAASITSAT